MNGTEVKGYISKIDEVSFTLTDKKTGQATTVPYADVQNLRGPGLSTGAKVALVVVAGVVIAIVAINQSVRQH